MEDFKEVVSTEEGVFAGIVEQLGNAYKKQEEAIKRIVANNIAAHPYRKHFLERLASMPQEIIDGLVSGRLQLSDARYYGTRTVGAASTVKIFQEDDAKSVGFCNVVQAKLQNDRPMVLSAINLSYHSGGTALDKTNINLFTAKAYTAEIAAGEWKLRLDSKDIYEEMPIGRTFGPGLHPAATTVPAVTQGTGAGLQATYDLSPSFAYASNKPYGLYELVNPKIVAPNKRIEFEMAFAAALSSTNHTFAVDLIGTTVRPN